jgi:hypothetical protein
MCLIFQEESLQNPLHPALDRNSWPSGIRKVDGMPRTARSTVIDPHAQRGLHWLKPLPASTA